MKWCHRAVRDKLKQLCEVFDIPVLEAPAAYSSRFCSRSGVAGFRAVEVAPGFEFEAPWRWLKDKVEKDGNLLEVAKNIRKVVVLLSEYNADKHQKLRTLLVPIAGGPMFVPISDSTSAKCVLQPKTVQADINAAINLGLRAIADPRVWEIHPRLRTEHKDGRLIAKEKRKFGEKAKVNIEARDTAEKEKKEDRNPNYFADFAGCAKWGKANSIPLVSGKALWGTVNELQWPRCMGINRLRIEKWKSTKTNDDLKY
jgi:hypothetical protein